MHEHHLTHYLTLILGLLATLFLFVYFKYNLTAQIIVSAVGCIYYALWGIVHHAIHNRLSAWVVVEYLLFGSLGFLIVSMFLYLM